MVHIFGCVPWSRLRSGIALRDKLCESLGESKLMHGSARNATEPPNATTKNVTKTQKSTIFVHMQNLGLPQAFSNECCGVSCVHQQLHLVCCLARTQPQPKRIGVTRVVAKKLAKTYKHVWCTFVALYSLKSFEKYTCSSRQALRATWGIIIGAQECAQRS